MPITFLDKFVVASGLQYADVYRIVIPARTLKHRKQRRESLNLDESDKLARLLRVFNQARSVFGANEKARHWLSTPKARFEQRTPLAMLRTEYGGRMVEEMLGQIDNGMFA